MKKYVSAFLMLIALSTMTFAAEKFYVAKITDHEGIDICRIVSPTELKNLVKNEALEKKYWAKALSLAQKEWSKNEEFKKESFPNSCASPVKVTPGQAINSQEEAQKKLSRYQNSQIEKKTKAEAALKKQKKPKEGDKAAARKTASAAAKAALASAARTMIETHLSSLMQPAGAPAEAAAEAPAE